MSFLKVLGLEGDIPGKARNEEETATVRRIVRELDELPRDRARYVAIFAAILARVAYADLDISEVETEKMEEIVQQYGGLSPEHAILVVQIAKSQNALLGGTENFLLTREYHQLASSEEIEQLLHCLFAVAAADGTISVTEEERIRQIATELGVGHREYVDIRSRYSAKREVMQKLRQQLGSEGERA
jgi:uncharacterized tellurite resistance protein B-like protein